MNPPVLTLDENASHMSERLHGQVSQLTRPGECFIESSLGSAIAIRPEYEGAVASLETDLDVVRDLRLRRHGFDNLVKQDSHSFAELGYIIVTDRCRAVKVVLHGGLLELPLLDVFYGIVGISQLQKPCHGRKITLCDEWPLDGEDVRDINAHEASEKPKNNCSDQMPDAAHRACIGGGGRDKLNTTRPEPDLAVAPPR